MEIKLNEVYIMEDGKTYHVECVNLDNFSQENFINKESIDDETILFCDECGELIA